MTNERADLAFIGGREVRIIPKGWQHPRDDRGRHVPLLPADYAFDDEEERAASTVGLMPDASRLPASETEIAAYEAVSEGTPISPAFPNTPAGKLALVNYCAEHETTFGDHRADAEAWATILFGDATVGIDGTVRAS
jgi:hypothetical protein